MSKQQPRVVRMMMDTMLNLVSGMGMGHDKNSHNTFVLNILTRPDLEAAYRSDWVSRKVIDIPAHDMTRAGRSWQTKKNNIEAIEAEEKKLGLWSKLNKAIKLARLDGGSAIIVGGPGNMDEALDPKDIRKGDLKFLWTVRRYDLRVVEKDYDLYSPFFGQAKMYELYNYGSKRWRIHPSRLIIFKGAEIPGDRDEAGEFWGDSVLQAVNDAVVNAGVAQAGIAGLIHEAKIDVISVPNLMENLSTDEYTQNLTKRFAYASMAKSSQNALVLDAEEKWERKQINFTQLPDVLKLYLQVASAAVDIPATRFVGLSPQGLNATGDTEERMYYDRINGDQKSWLQPKLEPLDEMIIRSALGRVPSDIFYKWNSLWQMSEKEQTDISKKKADTVKVITETNLIPPAVMQKAQVNQLIEDAMFPGFEEAVESFGEEAMGAHLEAVAAAAAAKEAEAAKTGEAEGGDPATTTDPSSPAPYTGGPTGNGETE